MAAFYTGYGAAVTSGCLAKGVSTVPARWLLLRRSPLRIASRPQLARKILAMQHEDPVLALVWHNAPVGLMYRKFWPVQRRFYARDAGVVFENDKDHFTPCAAPRCLRRIRLLTVKRAPE